MERAKNPRLRLRALLTLCLTALVGCTTIEGEEVDLTGQDVRLTILHTSDWHGRLLPYDMDVLLTDERLGLDPELGPFGGVARLAYLVNRERANAGRSILLDSGDCFQGAPIFNVFEGEVEFQAMSLLRPDGVVLGNHEFDNGLANLVDQARNFGQFPLLAANYHYLDRANPDDVNLGEVTQPYNVVNVDGLTIGIIGIANFSSLSSIGFADNSMRVIPMDIVQSVQHYINLLQPQVNVIVAVSHAGLEEDQEIIEQTVGLDMVFGGHLHIVLDPPRIVHDATGREVVLAHSGAFLKFLGRMDVVLRGREDDPHDFEVESHVYEVIPIDSTVPEDPTMLRMLDPYVRELRQEIDLTRILAYSPSRIRRFGSSGGDSPLGNFVADAIRTRRRVEADFAITNSLGIRSDIIQGPVVLDQTYNIFPFPNTITTMTLSGNEIQEMLDFNAERSASRGCATQLQVSGIEFTMDCSQRPAVARDINILRPVADRVLREPIRPNYFYTMATNDFIAGGGSGFRVLRFNNTQQDTGIAIRDAVNDAMTTQPSCYDRCLEAGQGVDDCLLLSRCRDDVTAYYGRSCAGLDAFSPRDRCIGDRAPSCLEASDQSDFDICRQFADPRCQDLYDEAARQSCYDDAQFRCLDETRDSPRDICARVAGAESCLEESGVAPLQACEETARHDAELICIRMPCLDAASDGRIDRILPSNEFVPVDDEDPFSGEDAAALMMELQASPHNDEACY
jgi:5'-nucleotidase/UDP-sugar diphosphatase